MKPVFFRDFFSRNRGLILAVLAFSAVYLLFFPPMYTAIDEHEYAKNAVLLSRGKLFDANPLDYCGGTFQNGSYRSTYPLGKSLFLIPFLSLGLEGLFLAGLLVHLLNFGIFAMILKRLKTDPRLAILYLFFPAFTWSSRTLYPELLVLTGALAGLFFYLGSTKKDWLLCGLFFGLATAVRYDAAFLFAGFAVVSLFRNHPRLVWTLLGAGLVGILILAANTALYGGPLNTPYGYDAIHFVANQNPAVLSNLPLLALILLLAYPLMLVAPLINKKKFGLEVFLSGLIVLYLVARNSNIAVFEFFSPLTFTGRMRYLIPIAGLLLVPYAVLAGDFLNRLTEKIKNREVFVTRLFWAAGIVLLLATVVLSFAHQDLLQKRAAVREQLFANTPENALVIGSSDDCIYFLKGVFSGRQYYKVDSNWSNPQTVADESGRPVFVMQLSHSNQSDSAIRQSVIDRERAAIGPFILQNRDRLKLVFETGNPHFLKIFEYRKETK